MIPLPNRDLSPDATGCLKELQDDVNGEPSYAEQVARAKTIWKNKNSPARKPCFDHIGATLTEMCRGARRCAYCEDSLADEIEHIKPKDLYPESAFVWENYLYACGPCNVAKSNKFSVFKPDTEEPVLITRARNAPVVPPLKGEPLFIDPRREDPMEFMRIDVLGTFLMLPKGRKDSEDREERLRYLRAERTISDLKLESGTAGHLPLARKQAYRNFKTRLGEIIAMIEEGKDVTRDIDEFKAMDHRSVWIEIKRSRRALPDFEVLFQKHPESLNW
ncbi:MAG: hypothetical protein QNK37_00975 [Acidobacteriota bacterium]|nr:hypothetical protein [Acidobacteriota bacterium]